ncbi:hypothetical protein P9202_935 [Prochlorococcus marinus str. MIT 9202]|nr:hypothetical protein P9202_935 [Prochlorococcus marinus str. MIT 9202]
MNEWKEKVEQITRIGFGLGKISDYLRGDLALNHLNMNRFFTLKFIFIISHFLERN